MLKTSTALLISLAMTLTSCASFRGGNSISDAKFAEAMSSQNPRKIMLNFDFVGPESEPSRELLKEGIGIRERFIQELGQTKYQLTHDRNQAEEIWNLKVRRQLKGESGIYGLTVATLFLVPSWFKQNYSAQLDITAKDGGAQLAKISADEDVTTVYEFFLFALAPIYYPLIVEKHVLTTIFRNILAQRK